MEEKNLNGPTGVVGAEGEPGIDYIQTIAELKQNSVSKDMYNKLKEENQKLLKSIINGDEIEVQSVEKTDVGKLRKELYGEDAQELTNLDYVTKMLALRNTLIEEGKEDPFLPKGHKVTLKAQDYEVADRVARVLQECVDYANGDSKLFTSALQSRMVN